MPSQIGTDLGIDLPTPGGDTGTWGTDLNTELQKVIDAVEGGTLVSVGLTVDDSIPMAGYSITDAGAYYFRNKSSAHTTASCIYLRDGDLYCNDSSGNEIRITASGSINASGVAGIGGDYGGANPAAATYNDANSKFVFVSDPNVPASVEHGSIRLQRTGETSPNAITIQGPVSLGSAYTITLFSALPASTSILTISSAGQVATSRDLTLDTLTCGPVTGTEVYGTTSVETGGTGILHAERSDVYAPWDGYAPNNSTWGTIVNGPAGTYYLVSGASEDGRHAIRVPVGSRIKSVTAYMLDSAGGTTMKLFEQGITTDDSGDQTGMTQTSTASGSRQSVAITGLTETVAAGSFYFVEFNWVASVRYYGLVVVVDKVA